MEHVLAIQVLAIFHDHEIKEYKALGFGTNSIGELMGVSIALDYINKSEEKITHIEINTDSMYVIGMLSKNWNAKRNIDLVNSIRNKISNSNKIISFNWIKGHSNNVGNEIADKLAVQGANESVI